MTGEKPGAVTRVSRRDFLVTAAVGGVAVAGMSLVTSPARAADKVPQKAVSYQQAPKGAQRCDNCVNFQPPGSCNLVDGAISPSGWCTLYKAKG